MRKEADIPSALQMAFSKHRTQIKIHVENQFDMYFYFSGILQTVSGILIFPSLYSWSLVLTLRSEPGIS